MPRAAPHYMVDVYNLIDGFSEDVPCKRFRITAMSDDGATMEAEALFRIHEPSLIRFRLRRVLRKGDQIVWDSVKERTQ
jgi:hypothetical protein